MNRINRRKVYTVNEVSFNIPDDIIEERREEQEGEEEDDVFSEYDKDTSCDWGTFRPKALQGYANLNCAMLWICCSALVLGIVSSGLINNVVETAEKRFSVDSTRSAFISSCYYLGVFVSVLPMSFFGSNSRKPRFMGAGMLILALGSAIFCIPSLFQNKIKSISQFPNLTERLCPNALVQEQSCSSLTDWFIWMMWVASFLLGVGSAPIYSLGIRYIDENSGQSKKSSINFGFFYFAHLIGVAAGYAMTKTLNPSYINTKPIYENYFGENWWVGFIGISVVSVLLSIPLMGLPKRMEDVDAEMYGNLPHLHKFRGRRPSEAYAVMEFLSTRLGMTCKQLGPNIKELFLNSTFMCVSLSMAARVAFLTGIATFGQKFVRSTFHNDTSFSFVLTGIYGIPASMIGTFLGAIFVAYSKATVATVLRTMVIISLTTFFPLCLFLMTCSPYQDQSLLYVGLNADYTKATFDPFSISLTNACNANCSCSTSQHFFICGADHRVYYSPCHAGCLSMEPNGTMFGNCSCISSNLLTNPNYQATSGICSAGCQSFWLFQVLLVFLLFLNCFISVPHLSVTFRCVAEKHRTMALAFQWMLICMFGAIPGPLILGYVIQQACVSWMDGCSGHGKGTSACVYYNENELRFTIMIISFVSYGLVSIFLTIALLIYQKPIVTRSLEMYLNWQERRLSTSSMPPGSAASVRRQQATTDVSDSDSSDDAEENLPGSRLKAPFKILRLPSDAEDRCNRIIASKRKRQLSEPQFKFPGEKTDTSGIKAAARRVQSIGAGYDPTRMSGAAIRDLYCGVNRTRSNADNKNGDLYRSRYLNARQNRHGYDNYIDNVDESGSHQFNHRLSTARCDEAPSTSNSLSDIISSSDSGNHHDNIQFHRNQNTEITKL